MPGLGQGSCNMTKVQRIIGIVERLRLRSSRRLTVNVIRNQPAISLAGQQRNRITLDETNIALPQEMEYDFSPLVGLRQSFASVLNTSCKNEGEMVSEESRDSKTIQEKMAEEELVKEKTDAEGNRWRKAYFGGGEHFENWLAQCRELGEVMVEEVDSTGYKCFEEGGEKLYRIWIKLDAGKEDDLF